MTTVTIAPVNLTKMADLCTHYQCAPETLIHILIRDSHERMNLNKYEVYDFKYFSSATIDTKGWLSAPSIKYNHVSHHMYGFDIFVVPSGDNVYLFNKQEALDKSKEGKLCSPTATIHVNDFDHKDIVDRIKSMFKTDPPSKRAVAFRRNTAMATLWVEENLAEGGDELNWRMNN